MTQRVLEEPRGYGRLVAEGLATNVSCTLLFTEEQIATANMDNPEATFRGSRTIDGRIEFENPSEETGTFGKLFTLHLENVRRLKVLTVGANVVIATGGFSSRGLASRARLTGDALAAYTLLPPLLCDIPEYLHTRTNS